MHARANRYVILECAISFAVNCILNFLAALLIFHGRSRIPTDGAGSLVRDLIGETFFVSFLSYLAASLISRHRRRAGTLPVSGDGRAAATGDIYLRSLIVGLIFTCILVALDAWSLPQIFPDGFSFQEVLLFKTIYGAILASIVTGIAILKAFHEIGAPAEDAVT